MERAIAGLRRRPPGQAVPGATAVVPAEANAAGAIEPETIVALSARHAIVTVAGGTSEVYLQVRAHLRLRQQHRNAQPLQQFARPDAR